MDKNVAQTAISRWEDVNWKIASQISRFLEKLTFVNGTVLFPLKPRLFSDFTVCFALEDQLVAKNFELGRSTHWVVTIS